MHETDAAAEKPRKIYTVTMTREQVKYLLSGPPGSPDWWERLADITEIAPEWLRANLNNLVIDFVGRRQFERLLKNRALPREKDRLYILRPVRQVNSGVLTVLEGIA